MKKAKVNNRNSGSDGGNSPTPTPIPTRRDIVAMETILAMKPELYVDVAGEPRIGLPFARGDPKPPQSPWSLRHDRVRAEIAEFVFQSAGIILFDQEITRILYVLEGKAWKDHRIDIELQQALDEEPLVEALFIFLHQPETEGRFQDSCSKLLTALTKIGRKNGVDTRSKAWPKGAPQLSGRLGQLEALLAKCGIKVARGRFVGGARYVKLESNFTCDGGKQTPSQTSSVDNKHHPKTLRIIDARDGAGGDVFDRIQTSE